jgi:hypothetical protein
MVRKGDNRFILNVLTCVRRNENEIVDEFNTIFDKLVQDIPIDLKPTTIMVI